jgi:hypothetical protein
VPDKYGAMENVSADLEMSLSSGHVRPTKRGRKPVNLLEF